MRWGLLLAIALCGRPSPQGFSNRWVDKTADDVLVAFGVPTELIPLGNGNQVYSYHVEQSVSSASGATRWSPASAESYTAYCDRRFEVDKTTRRIVRAVIAGSLCDYGR